MENSIFSGLTPSNLRIVMQAAGKSPEALGALAIVAVAAVLALALAGALAARHIGGFYAHIQEEEERQRLEEEALEQAQKERAATDSAVADAEERETT